MPAPSPPTTESLRDALRVAGSPLEAANRLGIRLGALRKQCLNTHSEPVREAFAHCVERGRQARGTGEDDS